MNTPDTTSPLLRAVMAGLKKNRKKGQFEESVEMAEHDETDLAQPEERHEVDIVMDMKSVCDRIEDEAIKNEMCALIEEMAAIHGVEKDVESIDEIEKGSEDAEISELEVPGASEVKDDEAGIEEEMD